jgi:hypothetical protein
MPTTIQDLKGGEEVRALIVGHQPPPYSAHIFADSDANAVNSTTSTINQQSDRSCLTFCCHHNLKAYSTTNNQKLTSSHNECSSFPPQAQPAIELEIPLISA